MAPRDLAANMLIAQEKTEHSASAGAIHQSRADRCHRIKMNKADFRELIAPVPVYPGVDGLSGESRERV